MKMNQINSIIFASMLSACTSSNHISHSSGQRPPLAESFAYERAASISQVIPIKIGRFLLEKSVANKSTVYLSLRALNVDDTNAFTIESEMNAIGNGLCQDKKTYLVIQQGVVYHFSFFNVQKIKLSDAIVNRETCVTKSFAVEQ